MKLLDKIIAKQRQRGLSDRQFAELLGVPRSTWQLTRSGTVAMGPRVARAAHRTFPDLAADATYFLLCDASEIANTAITSAEVA